MFYFNFVKVLSILSKTCFVLSFCFVFFSLLNAASSATECHPDACLKGGGGGGTGECGNALIAANKACADLTKKGMGYESILSLAVTAGTVTGGSGDKSLQASAYAIAGSTAASGAWQGANVGWCARKMHVCEKTCLQDLKDAADSVVCPPPQPDSPEQVTLCKEADIAKNFTAETYKTTPLLKSKEFTTIHKYLKECKSDHNTSQRTSGAWQALGNGLVSLAAFEAAKDLEDEDEEPAPAEQNLSLVDLDTGNGNGFNALNDPSASVSAQGIDSDILPEEPYYAEADPEPDAPQVDPSGSFGGGSPSAGKNPSPISSSGSGSLSAGASGGGGKKQKAQASKGSIGYGVGNGLSGSSGSSGSFGRGGYQGHIENAYLRRGSRKVAQLPKNKAGLKKRTAPRSGGKKSKSIFDKASNIIKNFCRTEASCK